VPADPHFAGLVVFWLMDPDSWRWFPPPLPESTIAAIYRHLVASATNGWGEMLGDEVMAAALIDRLVHHCHLVTIRGNSYRLREHTELWQALHAPQDPDPHAVRRRRTRQEVATI
jgi:hypothetical protein